MANAETSTAPIIQDGETLSFEHDGRVSELLPIVLLNALLNVLTLSLYRFWGKTRVRRYLWDNTNLLGDRLEYTGTGGELFKGFLFVLSPYSCRSPRRISSLPSTSRPIIRYKLFSDWRLALLLGA